MSILPGVRRTLICSIAALAASVAFAATPAHATPPQLPCFGPSQCQQYFQTLAATCQASQDDCQAAIEAFLGCNDPDTCQAAWCAPADNCQDYVRDHVLPCHDEDTCKAWLSQFGPPPGGGPPGGGPPCDDQESCEALMVEKGLCYDQKTCQAVLAAHGLCYDQASCSALFPKPPSGGPSGGPCSDQASCEAFLRGLAPQSSSPPPSGGSSKPSSSSSRRPAPSSRPTPSRPATKPAPKPKRRVCTKTRLKTRMRHGHFVWNLVKVRTPCTAKRHVKHTAHTHRTSGRRS